MLDTGFAPLFGHADTTTAMRQYIKTHFADLLGRHVALVDAPDGLEQLAALLKTGALGLPGSEA